MNSVEILDFFILYLFSICRRLPQFDTPFKKLF